MRRKRVMVLTAALVAGVLVLSLNRQVSPPAVRPMVTSDDRRTSPDGSPPAAAARERRPPPVDGIRPEDIAEFPEHAGLYYSHLHPPSPESVLARTDARLRALYQDVGEALGLTAERQERLVSLLVDQQVEPRVLPDLPVEAETDDAAFEAYLQEMRARHRRELAAVLDERERAALRRYQDSLEPRSEIENLREMLDIEERSLTDSQRQRLLESVLAPGAFLRRRAFSRAESREAMRQEVEARITQNDRRLLDMASVILTPGQFELYARYLDERRAGLIESELPELD